MADNIEGDICECKSEFKENFVTVQFLADTITIVGTFKFRLQPHQILSMFSLQKILTKLIPGSLPLSNNFEIYNYEDTSYTPWYFTGNNIPFLIIVKKECVDCRTQGGTNAKPSFW